MERILQLTKENLIKTVIPLVILITLFSAFVIVDAGERGVVLRLGKVDRIFKPGLNFKIPIVDKVVKMEVRTVKEEVKATASSNDLQIVSSDIAIQYNLIPESVGILYEEVGINYGTRIISPAIQDIVKATTANFTAEELITKRAEASEQMEVALRERLLEAHIHVSNVDIIDFNFSASFNDAIEKKVTAEQDALREENKLKQVEFEAQQKIVTATAEAEAIRIKVQAIRSQGGKDFVQLQAIEKWDGVLPTQFIPESTLPFINVVK